ncbi:MAG: OPT/YSL family transporter, partial [Planctomycetota bacterium]|nr:OPT/YSL family transporter [Planctomycetota bacterium]
MSDAEPRKPAATESVPDIPIRRGPYPEFTWTAVFLGWAIGALIAVSIGYAALILGFAIEGSELAAILGWGVLRGVLRRTSIVENNINQTIASAVNGASSGIMFSVPALFILSRTKGLESVADFNVPMMILACITGSVLGLAFVIPLRRQMIDFDRLAYPGGIAVATILKSPGAGVKKALLLLGGASFSGISTLLVMAWMGDDGDWHAGDQLGLPSMLNIVFYLSAMTIGVGFLSGKGGFWFGAGGFICYFVLSPLLSSFAVADPGAVASAQASVEYADVASVVSRPSE